MINEFVLQDAYEFIKSVDDNSIDLLCIDPPYEIDYNNEVWDRKILNWNDLFMQFNRVLKSTGNVIIFQGWSNVCTTITIGKEYFIFKNWLIYDRIKR